MHPGTRNILANLAPPSTKTTELTVKNREKSAKKAKTVGGIFTVFIKNTHF